MPLTSEQLYRLERHIGKLRCQREEHFDAAVKSGGEALRLSEEIEKLERELKALKLRRHYVGFTMNELASAWDHWWTAKAGTERQEHIDAMVYELRRRKNGVKGEEDGRA